MTHGIERITQLQSIQGVHMWQQCRAAVAGNAVMRIHALDVLCIDNKVPLV